LTQVANAVCNLPEDKKFINKKYKLIDRKTIFETDRFGLGMGEHLAYGSLLQERIQCSYLRSRRRAWNFLTVTQ
jgi:2-oxoglutarate dehydrogenase E1 component